MSGLWCEDFALGDFMVREKVFHHFFGRPDGDEVVEDWSLKLRSEISIDGVEGARHTAKEIYKDKDRSFSPDSAAYLLGASAGRVIDESYVDSDELVEHVRGVVPGVYREKVEEGLSDYRDGSLRF